MSARSTIVVALLCFAASACAENAIMELQIELPPAPTGETWYAEVQARNAEDFPFGIDWNSVSPSAIELTDSSQWDCISVEGADPSVNLNVRVRFCTADDCLAPADSEPPERLYHLEHPFYIGRRTYARSSITAFPNSATCGSDADCGGFGFCELTDPAHLNRCRCTSDDDCTAGSRLRCETTEFGTGAPGSNRCVEVFERCDIEGCISGESRTFCSSSGEHFCETGPDILRTESIECAVPE